MDRNSAIGLTLIAAMLLVYFYWFSPTPAPVTQEPVPAVEAPAEQRQQTLQAAPDTTTADSVLRMTYGDLASFVNGQEEITTVETNEIKLSFSNKGGIIRSAELPKYQTYYGEPLVLVSPEITSFELLAEYNGRPLDLYSLYYQVSKQTQGDSTVVVYSLSLPNGGAITQRYSIPSQGYQIGYSISSRGIDLGGESLSFNWKQIIPPTEKDLTETRNRTTVTWFSDNDGFSELPERSTDAEEEIIEEPFEWVAIKRNFFLSSLISDLGFARGKLMISTDVDDTTVVKTARIELSLPAETVTKQTARHKYYLGPNDYQIIGDVAPKFSKNVYLGWPPVYWINKFIIFPVFHFLTLHIGNYGLIIIILVILLKLVLAPLSYRSYLSMAKMKVLKPELDEIKEKHGEDMAKVQQEQLKLYQQVGVNPISGCIPVLLQMPILLAMFYLFPASIELRQEPLLWAEDLSTYDSIIEFAFTIPFMGNHISLFTVLMTVSTLIYTWQNNQLSSVQGPMKSMSYLMPLIFFFVLNSFSAGLTFYYFVSNLVTFAQQAIIRKFVNEDRIKVILEENRKKNLGGGKKSKFMAKLEEAMKASEGARKTAEENKKKRKK